MDSDTLPAAGRAMTPDPAPSAMPVRGRRRPWVVATGVLLTSLGALTVVWLVGAAGQRQEVLVVRQDVAYGQRIEERDLAIARVSLDPGVHAVAGADRDRVLGQVAATRLGPGMLLAPGMVEPAGEPRPGRVLVPIALPAERMPAGGLRAGDRILAVDAGGAASPPGSAMSRSAAGGSGTGRAGGMGSVPATVVRVGPPDVNGVVVVDVTTAAPDGPPLAVAAAHSQVALVLQPVGG
jgi:hypothetical protein